MANIMRLGGGGGKSAFPLFTYTGHAGLVPEDDGNWKIKFFSSGTLTLSEDAKVDIFLVGGGGGGGFSGGGGGGYTATHRNILLKADTPYAVTIGAGGSHRTAGGASSFNGTYTAAGGGTEKQYTGGMGNYGGDGGSGGGGAGGYYDRGGGAGGSNGSAGGNSATYGRAGGTGQGTTTREFGESTGTLYAGGGGGGGGQGYSGAGGAGGAGGGGNGGYYDKSTLTGFDGEDFLGGGGGGGTSLNSGSSTGGSGGCGIVIIRNAR